MSSGALQVIGQRHVTQAYHQHGLVPPSDPIEERKPMDNAMSEDHEQPNSSSTVDMIKKPLSPYLFYSQEVSTHFQTFIPLNWKLVSLYGIFIIKLNRRAIALLIHRDLTIFSLIITFSNGKSSRDYTLSGLPSKWWSMSPRCGTRWPRCRRPDTRWCLIRTGRALTNKRNKVKPTLFARVKLLAALDSLHQSMNPPTVRTSHRLEVPAIDLLLALNLNQALLRSLK